MDVSVIVPTRNRSALLMTTLRSVLLQRDVDLEVIVVDEASTDATTAALASIGDRRVRVVRHERALGVSAARNRGAAEARGEWVAFLDDDDLWAPRKLAAQLHAARAADRDWVYAGTVNLAEPWRVVHGVPPPAPEHVVASLPRYNSVPAGASNVMVRRATLLRAGPFDTRLRNTEDWEMWIRLAKAGPPAWVRSPLVAYRMHTSNSSLNVTEILRGARLIEDLHETTLDWGRFHLWIAQLQLRKGRRAAAVREYLHAIMSGEPTAGKELAAVAQDAIRRRLRGAAVPVSRTAHAGWMDEARTWVHELRALDAQRLAIGERR